MQMFSQMRRASSAISRVLTFAAVILPVTATAQERTLLTQLRPAAGGLDAGALPASQPVPSITLTLKRTPAQQADLEHYLRDVRTPGSTAYRRWLTPQQFASRFAPSGNSVMVWLAAQGLQITAVSPGGMRITASGTVAQANTTFAVSLHRLTTRSGEDTLVQGTPSVPTALSSVVTSVSGLASSADALTTLASAIDADTSTVVAADLQASKATADDLAPVLEQAAAQGQTVVLTHVPNLLVPERALVLTSTVATPPDTTMLNTPRPDWQVAPGLPPDGLRAAPDAAAADVAAVVSALQTVVLKNGRQGEIAARFYAVATEPGVFTHADASLPAGTWTAADGLGTIDVAKLVKALAVGSTPPLNSSIVLSSRNVTHGQAITLTATITGGSGTPTGTVTFATAQDGTIGSAALAAGSTAGTAVATFSTNSLPGGLHGFYGTYNGDSTYSTGTTNVDTATVQPEAAAVTANVSGSQPVGTSMPIAVIVKSSSGVGTPTGGVTVYAYGTALGQTAFTGTLSSAVAGTASAIVTIPATNAGSYTFQANCSSDASFSCGQPVTFPVTVSKGSPSFTLKQAGPSTAATLTATAAVPTGAAGTVVAPTGTVQFLDNGTSIGSGTLNTSGVATYTGALGSGATHMVTANYSGDGNYTTATATANAATKVTPSVLLTVVTAGSSLSVTVASPAGTATTPTGTVQFLLGTAVLGTANLSNGSATLNSTYSSGILTAVYSGDTNFNTATSNAIDTTKITPTLTLTSTGATSADGTVALSVALTSTSTRTATGTVTFVDGTTPIGTGTLSASGVAIFSGALAAASFRTASIRALATATQTHTLTATYPGDTNFNAAVSNAVTANVTTTQIATTTALTSSSGYSGSYGSSFTFNVVVTPASYVASGASPTGTVTLRDASGVVGMGTLSAGSASVVLSTLSVGPHALTATYGGDTNYAASTSSPAVTVTIAAVNATVSAAVSPTGPIPYGYDATLNITVTATSGTVGPAGVVTATINGSTYTATLSATTGSLASTASISFPVPPPGSYTITVVCGTGITCTAGATAKLTSTKGYTKTVVDAGSSTPQVGVSTTLSATVANSGTGSGTYSYSGTVTFYAGSKRLATAPVANGVATASVTYTSAATQAVYAVYGGDMNWNGSTSDSVAVAPLPAQSVIGLTVNTQNGIVSQNITLTASVGSGLTGVVLVPTGTITFYDTFNGIVVNLGTASLLSNGLNAAYATLSTTGLQAGTHSIVAIYAGDTSFTQVTSTALSVSMSDFSLSFTPANPVILQGGSGSTTVVVGSVNGYTGTIALGCTPPGGTFTSCSVSPATVSAGGTATVTILTTKSTALLVPPPSGSVPTTMLATMGAGALVLCVMRCRRVASLLVLLVAAMVISGGCTQVSTTSDGGGSSPTGPTTNNGTPLGTLSFTVSGVATSAPVAARHTATVQVTVQ